MTARELNAHEQRLNALRLENSARCAAHLREIGPATVAEIAEATGLSRPTVSDRIADLAEQGIVVEVSKTESIGQSSGRPAARFAFNGSAAYVVGVELGKHRERIVFCDLAGDVIASFDHETSPTLNATERLELLRTRIDENAQTVSAWLGDWVGLGVAVPGTLSPEGVMYRSPVFDEWAGADIRGIFEQYFSVPLFLENDINAACVAEHRLGAARDVDDVVLALLWHQVAAGVLINGGLHRGVHHLAGELNQLVSTQDTDESDKLWPSMPEFLETLAAAERGDDAARHVVERFATKTAGQLAAIVVTLDPQLLLLHGPAAESEFLVDLVREALSYSINPPIELSVRASGLGQDGPVLGVILTALDAANVAVFGIGPTDRIIGLNHVDESSSKTPAA